MAKKKKRGRKQGLFSKVVNVGLIAFAFSRIFTIFAAEGGLTTAFSRRLVREATFGLADGGFDLNAGLAMYAPVAGAFALGAVKKFLMKKFPVR